MKRNNFASTIFKEKREENKITIKESLVCSPKLEVIFMNIGERSDEDRNIKIKNYLNLHYSSISKIINRRNK